MLNLINRTFLLAGVLFFATSIKAQKENNLLKKHEIELLRLLLADTSHNTSFTLKNTFSFGLENLLFTNTNIIKKGKDIFIQPLGTGRIYKAINNNGKIAIERMDQTFHSGVSFYAQNFIIKDTLYQLGGQGFWGIRGILTYYSPKTKQWELVQTNRAIQTYFDDQKDAVLHFDEQRPDPKLYVSNSYYYPNYPSSFEIGSTDSCYVYDFNSRTWTALGKVTPAYKKVFDFKHSHEMDLHINKLLIFQTQLEFYWADFEHNLLGPFNTDENNRLREIWLSTYKNDKTGKQTGFQFILGDDFYFMELSEGINLTWTKTKINLNKINKTAAVAIYKSNRNILESIENFYSENKSSLLVALLLVIIGITTRFNMFKRKRIPQELIVILYDNFFHSLTIIEKELIEALYNSNLNREELSTKSINKIIGVQQKDTLTQNKSRSDHFIKINQKFMMCTQNTDSLFNKTRDSVDKRQYNYSINPIYLQAIEKLLKD
jgi:hypothetical protein